MLLSIRAVRGRIPAHITFIPTPLTHAFVRVGKIFVPLVLPWKISRR
jgi:hypothetical protein